jgi:hypothetical protein
MNESTGSETPKRRGRAPKEGASDVLAHLEPATIVKRQTRQNKRIQALLARKLGGVYRVIHGKLTLPRPAAEWQNADGTPKDNESPHLMALPGDEVRLNDLDAAILIDRSVIEPLSANPSKLNKRLFPDGVWTPPKSNQPDMNSIVPDDDSPEDTNAARGYGAG